MSSGFEPGGRRSHPRLPSEVLLPHLVLSPPPIVTMAFPPALVQDFSWRDSNDEAEYRDVSVQAKREPDLQIGLANTV